MTSLESPSSRAVEWLVAGLVACGLLMASDVLQPSATAPFGGHGVRFAEMAADPLALEGAFPQRILWPLLAWLFSFVGVSVMGFTQCCNGALLAVVFWFARRRTGSFLNAGLVCAAVAVSGAVLVYKPMACLSDSLNLLLLVLLVHFVARPLVFWPLVMLSALSHELIFFFSPWLLYVRCRNGGVLLREGALLAGCLLGYVVWRSLTPGDYDSSYYFENSFWFPWCMPAMWALWAFLVLVEFGPLLVALSYGAGADGALRERSALGGRWGLCLYVVGILPMMLLAYDVMRFATFVFLPIMLSSIALVQRQHGRVWLAALVGAAVVSYAWLHPVASEQGGRHFTEIAGHIQQLLPGRVEPKEPMAIEHAWTFTMELAARWWPVALWSAAAIAVMSVLGTWLRRQS